MTVGEKILQLNLELQNLQSDNNNIFFTKTFPQKLKEIRDFMVHVQNLHGGVTSRADECINTLDNAVKDIETIMDDPQPNDFHKDRHVQSVKKSVRLVLLAVYDQCCHESVNIAQQPL